MALGNAGQGNRNYNNGQNNTQMWEPSYYSRLRIKNNDNLAITFTFWKGTLKVCISENGSAQEGRNNELAFIHLSPTKARLMSEGVKKVIDSVEDQTFGVDTGVGETRGFIAIGRNMGVPFLFIGKVNSNGQFESYQNFVFNTNYNYLYKVHNFVGNKPMEQKDLEKRFNDNLELEQLYDVFTDYSRSASGALGASFYDIGRYEAAKTSNLIRKIAEKNGISVPGGEQTKGNNSFFSGVNSNNNNDSRSSNNNVSISRKYTNIDDLESELE